MHPLDPAEKGLKINEFLRWFSIHLSGLIRKGSGEYLGLKWLCIDPNFSLIPFL